MVIQYFRFPTSKHVAHSDKSLSTKHFQRIFDILPDNLQYYTIDAYLDSFIKSAP